MPVNNHDKGLPSTPNAGVRIDFTAPEGSGENKLPILTNNFTPDSPPNAILWGPNQPWVDINTYRGPKNWRAKELLSIPRVVRMVVAKSDPCDHKPALSEGDFTCTHINLGDGFWVLHVAHLIQMGMDVGPTIIVFCSSTIYYQDPPAVNVLFSGDYPSPDFNDCNVVGGGPGHLNIYGDDGMGHLKATVTINGTTFGDEV